MTDFVPTLLVLAAQVTVPIVGGLLLSRRRDPAAACGPLVVAAMAVLLLTPLAFLPRPGWLTSDRPTEAAPQVAAADEATPAAEAATPPGIDVLKLLRLAQPGPGASPPAGFDGWGTVAFAFVGLAGLGLVRLALGLAHTARVVRLARPVHDPEMLGLLTELRAALGSRRAPELRESERVGTAATAGWRRPVVLISSAWRQWSAAERRAVLAHEIAHVVRGDFASRLLAQVGVAVHGYHPLVRWLGARLAVRQEMAADAVAARSCGGRAAYLRCLAALALRADDRPVGPVPTFLSGPRTLLRRIAMLRVTDDTPARRCWPARLAVALLAAGALGLHGAQPDVLAGPVVPAKFVEKKERPRLDASFILPSDEADQIGVFAIRVGELLRTPGMEHVAELYAGAVKTIVGDKEVHFKLTDVEQISGRVTVTHDSTKPPPNRSLSLSLTSVRMAKDFDWVKQLRAWAAEWKEHSHGGEKYYSAKVLIPALGPVDRTMWFYLPDARTVVVESEENVKKLIDAKAKPLPASAWAADWKAVEDGMFALALTDVNGKLAKKIAADEKSSDPVQQAALKAVSGICRKARRATVGIDLAGGCSVKVRLACATAADAADVDDGCQALVKLAEAAIEADKDEPKDAVEKAGKKLSTLLVRGVEFDKTVDHVVEIRMSAAGALTDLLKAFGAK
jgi:beta-lactamase regulating signal transducer with metallopeptidase domain